MSGTASPIEDCIEEEEEKEMEVLRKHSPSPPCHSPSSPVRGDSSSRGRGRCGRGHVPYVEVAQGVY